MRYTYRPQVLQELEKHGIQPGPSTQPALVHEFVNDLYRFELRRLKERHARGEIAKQDYSGFVVELRKRYILVSVPVRHWTQSDGPTDLGS